MRRLAFCRRVGALGALPSQAGARPARRAGRRPMLKVGSMPNQAEDGMRATLERIAALLEP
jgi:hypothetical protein